VEDDAMSNSAREAILGSIRSHLAASVPYDERELPVNHENPVILSNAPRKLTSIVDSFKQSLEAVDGYCVIASGETEIAAALTQIISRLQQTKLRAQRIAISDVPEVERLMHLTDLDIEALAVAPNAADIFSFDVGISTVQAAIAETGTLVLEATSERHRLISLVPPVHIAILDASRIFETLGGALAFLQKDEAVSPAVAFVTGPSRTGDIELTLAIGVHGPQELHVIINRLA
jgi:L-lactate dehydrogenase complex protein LldG